MIYQVRRGALTKRTVWRLEDAVLAEDGPRHRSFPLSQLKFARLMRGPGPAERLVVMAFGRRRIAIGSMSYSGLGQRTDQSETFAPFARALLAQAAAASPTARFQLTGDLKLGIYCGVLAILAAGLVLTLTATVAAGQVALGVDLGARMSFALMLMLTPLPWLHGLSRRTFDPCDAPI